jgi:hypothetical protein
MIRLTNEQWERIRKHVRTPPSPAAAPTLGVTVVSAPCGKAAHIESAFNARAREGGGGIVGIPDTFSHVVMLERLG